MKIGALQSAPFRQLITPDPYSPPIRNAAFFSDGMTTTHCDFAQRSCGMPLSGAPRISLMMVVDSLKRLDSSLEILATAELAARVTAQPIVTINLMLMGKLLVARSVQPE